MRKTLPTMAKAALATLLAWGGTAQVGAQEASDATTGAKVILVNQDYESATETDWTNHSESGTYTISTDNTNKYAYNANAATTNGYVHAYKSVSLSEEVGQGYKDANMTEKGYVVAFDFSVFPPTVSKSTTSHVLQLIVSTETEPVLTSEGKYSGSDYIFALQSHQISNSGSSRYLVTAYYRANDLSKDAFGNQNTNDQYDFKLTSGNWYHLELVVTAGSCAYTITPLNDASTETASGTLSFNDNTTGVPVVKSVLAVLGRAKSSSRPCYLKFDNFQVYHYVANSSDRTPEAPAIAWNSANSTGATYTLSFTNFKQGDVLHYRFLPTGQTDGNWTTVSNGNPVSYEATTSGTIEAKTSYNGKESSTVTEDVKVFTVDISTKSNLCSFSSGANVRVPNDVAIYIINKTNTIDGTTTSVTLKKVTGFQSGMQILLSNTGVFLYKEGGGSVTLPNVSENGIANADQVLYDDNLLSGTGESTVEAIDEKDRNNQEHYYYCLKKDEAALRRLKTYPNNITIPAHKAYLMMLKSDIDMASANLSLVFEDDDATGIDGVKNEKGDAGNQGALYNLAGQRVDDTYKGLVVQNGRKYLKK